MEAVPSVMLMRDLSYILPELFLTVGVLITLTAGLVFRQNTKWIKWLTVGFLGINLLLCLTSTATLKDIFFGQISIGSEVNATRLLLATTGLLVILATRSRAISKSQLEYFLLILGIQLGAQITVMASHALTILLSVELMSLSSYALAGYLFQPKSSEAGMKYFVFGSTATALMAFGFSWIYGSTGNLSWPALSIFLATAELTANGAVLGFFLMTAGLLFKLSAAPMHFWAPDVFETSPLPVINLFSTLPKIAAIVLLSRLVTPDLYNTSFWTTFVATVSVGTMVLGNFPALWQSNARRLLGYSSIAQAGFLFSSLCIAPGQQSTALLFYVLTMALAVTLVTYCLEWFESNHRTSTLESFAGLGRTAVLPSAGLTIGLFSLTGLPPFAGFSAKLLLFTSIWSSHPESNPAITVLLAAGVLTTVIALFYYIKIPLQLYLKDRAELLQEATLKTTDTILILSLSGILILLFLYPQAVGFLLQN